jgi:hypothetical protein
MYEALKFFSSIGTKLVTRKHVAVSQHPYASYAFDQSFVNTLIMLLTLVHDASWAYE